jgi:hypothetical protein
MPTYGIAGRITCVAAFAALVMGSADTASAQSACAKLWLRVAADGAKAAAACHGKAAATGGAVDPACLTAVEEKVTRKWAKATLKGDCPTAADAAAAQSRIDAFIASIVELLTPTRCCNTGNTGSACYAGPTMDAEGCSELLGTLGPGGSVCEGSTGTCVAPPGAGGSCCSLPFSVCTAGPSVPPASCVAAGGVDMPNAVCTESGTCAMP